MNEFKYVPDSYNYEKINKIKLTKEEFLNFQIKYRIDFERILKSIIDFNKIDSYIESFAYNIPIIDDEDYNFYRKFSTLGSKYIYIRNNIHIENLSIEEINIIDVSIKNNKLLDYTFLLATFKKVFYEEGDFSMFGVPISKNIVNSKSLVFEFAYDQLRFMNVSQHKFIDKTKEQLEVLLMKSINKVINTNVSLISYNGIRDVYAVEMKNKKLAEFEF